jgi:hypothetical protein
MKSIKFVTLDSMKSLSEELSLSIKKTTPEIDMKISNYLVKKGNSNFIDLYNDFVKNKNHKETLIKLEI